ncbi:MAG: hypothetical protein KGZ67_08125 [Hydrogenophaga sp.]|jgi:hypothetical protein|nr:hypothetical protein [Hydrogenophaga sp.]
MGAAPVLAHLDRSADFVVKVWADGAVVYDEADGSLQALNPVAGEAFQRLLEQPGLSPTALGRLLLQEEPDAEDLRLVADLLREFESLGLWERAPA